MANTYNRDYGKGYRMKNGAVGDLIQLLGVVLLGGGLTCEIMQGGDIYLVVITLGCIIFTLGTKVKGS